MIAKSISFHLLGMLLLATTTTEAFQPISSIKNNKSSSISSIWNPGKQEDSSTTKQYLVSLSTFTANENDITPDDWKDAANKAFEINKRPIILFDGICNLCNGGVNFALDNDPNATFRFASLQSKTGQSLLIQAGRHPKDMSSIIVITGSDGSHYDKSDAVLYISQGLEGLGFKALASTGSLVPKSIRDFLYHIISENRFRFGQVADQCRIDFDGEFDGRFVEDPPQSLSLCASSD